MTDAATRIAATLRAGLPAFLPRQRWFSGKGRVIEDVSLADAADVSEGDDGPYLALVRVYYRDGGAETYLMTLLATRHPPPGATIGRLDDADGTALIEATTDPDAGRIVLAGFAGRAHVATVNGAHVAYGDVAPDEAPPVGAHGLRPLGAEQSNTSLLVDDRAVFKLFRRIEPGENPEIEIGRFLTRHTTFRAAPRLLGSLSRVAANGERESLGVLQSFVKSRGDGWRYLLDGLRRWRDGGLTTQALQHEARMLGAVTGAMHRALASAPTVAGFATPGVTPADTAAWRAAFDARARRAIETLRAGLARLPDAVRADARALLERAPALVGRATPPDPAVTGPFDLIRVHGDYHLGQTLRGEDDYIVMDFEGEPARPLAERRAPTCALKDVAGMLRSFDYAFATVRAEAGPPFDDPPLRAAYLAAYLEAAPPDQVGFLPADHAGVRAWSDYFELDKALYEIEYETNNRPAWLGIPLGGARRLMEAP